MTREEAVEEGKQWCENAGCNCTVEIHVLEAPFLGPGMWQINMQHEDDCVVTQRKKVHGSRVAVARFN